MKNIFSFKKLIKTLNIITITLLTSLIAIGSYLHINNLVEANASTNIANSNGIYNLVFKENSSFNEVLKLGGLNSKNVGIMSLTGYTIQNNNYISSFIKY